MFGYLIEKLKTNIEPKTEKEKKDMQMYFAIFLFFLLLILFLGFRIL